jgi:hypothetical protein
MMERIGETSPRFEARITGAFYLLTIMTGIFAQGFVSDSLVVDGDAAVALVFFGFYNTPDRLPHYQVHLPASDSGLLSVFGGLGWLTFLYQLLGYHLFPYIAALGLLGAASLVLWFLVFGVNEQRWTEQASAAGDR